MTTYDYRSISTRTGILTLVLSACAIINLIIHLHDAMNGNFFKLMVAGWLLLGCISIDVLKNGIKTKIARRRNPRTFA